VNVGWGTSWQSDPSIHNCSISYAMDPGSKSGWSGSFEHSNSQCLESERGWGMKSSAAVG
jgi:hypothetical protein